MFRWVERSLKSPVSSSQNTTHFKTQIVSWFCIYPVAPQQLCWLQFVSHAPHQRSVVAECSGTKFLKKGRLIYGINKCTCTAIHSDIFRTVNSTHLTLRCSKVAKNTTQSCFKGIVHPKWKLPHDLHTLKQLYMTFFFQTNTIGVIYIKNKCPGSSKWGVNKGLLSRIVVTKQNTRHELEVKSVNLYRKMSEDFNISQAKTGFPLL